MGFRAGAVIIFLSFFCTVAMPVVAQSRTNTKAAGEALLKEAAKKRAEAERLEKEADAARAEVARLKKSLAEREVRIAERAKEIDRLKKEKIETLRALVAHMMSNPKVGHLLREDPDRIKLVSNIKRILEKQPWLASHLETILDEYRDPL